MFDGRAFTDEGTGFSELLTAELEESFSCGSVVLPVLTLPFFSSRKTLLPEDFLEVLSGYCKLLEFSGSSSNDLDQPESLSCLEISLKEYCRVGIFDVGISCKQQEQYT